MSKYYCYVIYLEKTGEFEEMDSWFSPDCFKELAEDLGLSVISHRRIPKPALEDFVVVINFDDPTD